MVKLYDDSASTVTIKVRSFRSADYIATAVNGDSFDVGFNELGQITEITVSETRTVKLVDKYDRRLPENRKNVA